MKLLVTDYDNTLELHYDFTDNENILKKNIMALNNFMKENIVCIATGRHFDAIYKTLIDKNIKFNYLCANNGAELYDNNYNLLFSLPIDKKDLNIIKKIGKKVFFRNPYKNNLITSVNIYIDNIDEYNLMQNYLDYNLKSSYIEYKFPKIKIINNKCNKANTIEIIKKIEKIENENIYAIGDDINDMEMILKYNGYTLNTAKSEVKKIALNRYNELNELVYYINNI